MKPLIGIAIALRRTKVSLNTCKTNFMLLGTPKNFNITLDDTFSQRVNYTKFLGVLIGDLYMEKPGILRYHY